MRLQWSDTAALPVAPAGGPAPYTRTADGVRLRVQVTPRASRERIGQVADDGRTARLRLSVTAAPHEGKANAAIIALLARTLRLPKSALTIVAGHAGREKTIAIRGDGAVIADAIDALAGAPEGRR